MLTNKKTNSNRKWMYLLVLPVIGLTIMSFQQPVEQAISNSSMIEIVKDNFIPLPFSNIDGDIPSRFPLDEEFKNAVTNNYGVDFKNPVTGKLITHKGIDYRAPKGTPIFASGNGIIATSEYHEKYGKLVIIQHQDYYVSLYAHLDELKVAIGEEVKIGQVIGTVGSTGLSTGDHLHYEVRKDGENVDPAEYF